MTPRGTDWTLALLVALGLATGVLSLFGGRPGDSWVIALHGAGGGALGLLTGWKLRRVWGRLTRLSAWDNAALPGLASAALVLATLLSGWVWAGGGDLYLVGYNLLNWHIGLGVFLSLAVGLHAWARAKPLRTRELRSRRQLLHAVGLAAGGFLLLKAQRPAAAALGWRGAGRRWTGSYEAASFEGNAFPATSWVADRPRPLAPESYRLGVGGLARTPRSLALAEIDHEDRLVATLDCTGGFYSTQEWRGVLLGRLLDAAGPLPSATHALVVSRTGYRWSFPISEASGFLLATRVGGEPLSHSHGAPVRLVAPERRGLEWIKWVVRVDLIDGPDLGQAASTVWSSLTPEGRGEAS